MVSPEALIHTSVWALGLALRLKWEDTEKVPGLPSGGHCSSSSRDSHEALAKTQPPGPAASGFPAMESGNLNFHKQSQEILMHQKVWDAWL